MSEGPSTRERQLLKAGSQVWCARQGGLRVVAVEPELYARTLELRPKGAFPTSLPWVEVTVLEGWL